MNLLSDITDLVIFLEFLESIRCSNYFNKLIEGEDLVQHLVSYQSGANRQIDESAISLTISDVNGQHKADRTDISVVLDKSYLWFGNGWVDVEGDNHPVDVSFVGTSTTDATLTLGSHATNPDNAGDTLVWKENPDGSKVIYTDSIDAPEIHFDHE